MALMHGIIVLFTLAQMQMPMGHEHMHMSHDPASALLMRQASGTSMNPAAVPMHMAALHGVAFVNAATNSGPRGGDKIFSTNWMMAMADRPLAGGHVMFRSMLSLEPATVGHKYPELFQSGEGVIDGQHPHDLFMELAAEYARPLTASTVAYLYAAPVGDPALGPVAFPHRASAAEIPQAPLSHHVQDSTHIAGSVLTLGAQSGMLGYAVSGFHGREPDNTNRWDIDAGRIDSWSARVTFDPTPNVTAQLSTSHLVHPEATEPGNIQRTTASVAYSTATSSTSLIYGHNDKSAGPSANAWLVESLLKFDANYVTGRAEVVDKDELIAGEVIRVKALTLGYSRDVLPYAAVGANATRYWIPAAAKAEYGNSPRALYLFVRLRSHG